MRKYVPFVWFAVAFVLASLLLLARITGDDGFSWLLLGGEVACVGQFLHGLR